MWWNSWEMAYHLQQKIFVRFGRIDRCILNVMPCLWNAHGMPRLRPQQSPHEEGGQIQWVCMHATIFRNKNKKHIAWMLATANNSQLENCFEALWMAFQFHLRIYATWNANRSPTDTFACDQNEPPERKETSCAQMCRTSTTKSLRGRGEGGGVERSPFSGYKYIGTRRRRGQFLETIVDRKHYHSYLSWN